MPSSEFYPPVPDLSTALYLRKVFKELAEGKYFDVPLPYPELESEVYREVPFRASTLGRCAVANTWSILEYYYPQKEFTAKFVDKLCGYREGYSTWPTQGLIRLNQYARMTVRWIGGVDLRILADSPEIYLWLEHDGDRAAYEYQLRTSDLPAEKAHAARYLRMGGIFENRFGTIEDIKLYLSCDCLPRVSVNAALLPNAISNDYLPHSLLIVGYTEDSVIVHNADHINGNVPNQVIPWEQFEQAWEGRGRRLVVAGREAPFVSPLDE